MRRRVFLSCIVKRIVDLLFPTKKVFILSQSKMVDYQISAEHIRHCMLFHFFIGILRNNRNKKDCNIHGGRFDQ